MSTSLIPFNNASTSHEQQIRSLQQELYARNRQLSEAEDALRIERQKSAQIERGVQELRTVLGPLYGALQHIHGEIDAMGVPGEATPETKHSAVWDSWKQKLGGKPAQAIDALLLHGSMSQQQLRIHLRCGTDYVYQVVAKLNKAGIITKNGGKIALKEL